MTGEPCPCGCGMTREDAEAITGLVQKGLVQPTAEGDMRLTDLGRAAAADILERDAVQHLLRRRRRPPAPPTGGKP